MKNGRYITRELKYHVIFSTFSWNILSHDVFWPITHKRKNSMDPNDIQFGHGLRFTLKAVPFSSIGNKIAAWSGSFNDRVCIINASLFRCDNVLIWQRPHQTAKRIWHFIIILFTTMNNKHLFTLYGVISAYIYTFCTLIFLFFILTVISYVWL